MGTYLGHVTHLLNSSIDYRALLDAADRRWDNEGSYSWLLPCSLVEKLQAELSRGVLDANIQSSSSVQPTPRQASGAQEVAMPSATVPAGT
jgi:hypothetical protein